MSIKINTMIKLKVYQLDKSEPKRSWGRRRRVAIIALFTEGIKGGFRVKTLPRRWTAAVTAP